MLMMSGCNGSNLGYYRVQTLWHQLLWTQLLCP